MPYCANCGTEVENEARFCSECGKTLDIRQTSYKDSLRNRIRDNKWLLPVSISIVAALLLLGGVFLIPVLFGYNDFLSEFNKEMVDAGLNHPSDFFSQNSFDPGLSTVEQEDVKPVIKESTDREYSIKNATIQIEILEDSTMHVKEKRTYFFNGSFKGLYQWFNKKSGIELIDFKVEENGVYFDFNPGRTYGPTGTFFIDEDSDSVLVDWSIEAKDEIRSFELHYKVLNAIKFQGDQAEIYWQFIGDEWDVPTEKVFISLVIPEGASIQEIEAFGYGFSHGKLSVIKPNEIIWEIDYLPERTFLEGRVIFPARLLRDVNN